MHEIVLEGPAKNALGTKMMQRVRHELKNADGAPVLLTGAGDAFSAGLNLKELLGLDAEGMAAFLTELDELLTALFHYPGPTAAVVNGHAIAGGCLVQMFCDVRVAQASPSARIGLNEVGLGLAFPPKLVEMVKYRLDPRYCEEVLLRASLYGPQGALRVGLVDAVSQNARQEATRRLKFRSQNPPKAYAAAKAALRGHIGRDDPAAMKKFTEEVLPVWTSEELKDTIRGFLNR